MTRRTPAELRRAADVLRDQSIRHRALDEAEVLLTRAAHITSGHKGHTEQLRADLVNALASGQLAPGTDAVRTRYAELVAAHIAEHPGQVALASGRDPFTAAANRCHAEAFELLQQAGEHAGKVLRSRIRDAEKDVVKLTVKIGPDAASAPLDISVDRRLVESRLDLEQHRRVAARARDALHVLLDLGVVAHEPDEQTAQDLVDAHFRALASGTLHYRMDDDDARKAGQVAVSGQRSPLDDPRVIVAGLIGSGW